MDAKRWCPENSLKKPLGQCLGKRLRDERDIRKVAMKLAPKLCYPNKKSPEIYPTLGGVGARRGSRKVTDWLTDWLTDWTD